MPVEPLAVSQLTLSTDPASLGFVTTADLEPVEGIVGQDRAVEAVDFALAIRRHGFNVYVQGPEGSGRTTLLRGATARASEADPVPARTEAGGASLVPWRAYPPRRLIHGTAGR